MRLEQYCELQNAIQSLMNNQQSESGPKTIVFVQRKSRAIELWKMLSSADRGHKVGVHHSSLKDDTRRLVEDQFKQGILSIVIATIGFGMVFSNNTLQDPVNKIYYNIYCRE